MGDLEMRKDENGHITVETTGTFILFVLFVVSILSLVNIVTLQTRIHYALTQAAQTISIYAYTLELTGLADDLKSIDAGASRVRSGVDQIKSDIRGAISGIKSLSPSSAAEHGGSAANHVIGWGEEIAADPAEMMASVLDYGLGTGISLVFEQIARPLVGRYLSNGNVSGDEYLRSVNVVDGLDGLDFASFSLFDPAHSGAGSVLIDENGNVRLVVRYEIEYRFGALPLPFRPVLSVTQTAVTKAWLGGRGQGYLGGGKS